MTGRLCGSTDLTDKHVIYLLKKKKDPSSLYLTQVAHLLALFVGPLLGSLLVQ